MAAAALWVSSSSFLWLGCSECAALESMRISFSLLSSSKRSGLPYSLRFFGCTCLETGLFAFCILIWVFSPI